MSKWLLSTQEGDQLWPKVTKQPMAVRVHGAGDEDARPISQHFAPQINHFHQAQASNRARSGLEVYKARSRPVPGLELTYSYNHGLEYLDINVSVELAEALRRVSAEDFWDFALVEIVLDDGYFDDGAVQLSCYAHMTGPDEGALTDASVWPVNGVASNERIRATKDPIINAANSAAVIVDKSTTGGEMTAASFTVDLRQSRGGASKLDVYAYLFVRDEVIPLISLLWAQNGYVVEDPSGTMGPVHSDVQPPVPSDDLSNWTDPPPLIVAGHVPPTHFDRMTLSWVFDANGANVLVYDNGYAYDGWLRPGTASNPSSDPIFAPGQPTNADMYVPGDPLFFTNPWHKTHNWWFWHIFPTTAYMPPYSGPNPASAKLLVSLFKGVPPLDAVSFLHAVRWGLAPQDAVVVPMLITDIAVPAYSNSTFPIPSGGLTHLLKNFFDIPKMGSVTLDTHRLIRGRPGIITNASFNVA